MLQNSISLKIPIKNNENKRNSQIFYIFSWQSRIAVGLILKDKYLSRFHSEYFNTWLAYRTITSTVTRQIQYACLPMPKAKLTYKRLSPFSLEPQIDRCNMGPTSHVRLPKRITLWVIYIWRNARFLALNSGPKQESTQLFHQSYAICYSFCTILIFP